jgi:hypothetical protein
VVAVLPAALSCVLFNDAAVCGTADCAPVTPFCGVVIGTPDGVLAVALVPGEAVGFTIGVEFGFGVGVIGWMPSVVAALGFTIGLDVGFGFGLEFGFGAGAVVIGVPAVAAAGLVPDAFELEFDDAELLAEFVAPLALLEPVAVLPLEPVDPELPPDV